MEVSTNPHKISDAALLLIKLLMVITFILYNKKKHWFYIQRLCKNKNI